MFGAFFRFLGLLILVFIVWTILKIVFNIILALFRIRLAVKMGMGNTAQRGPSPSAPQSGGMIAEMTRDPVCGSYVSVGHSFSGTFKGERQHFCSQKCMDEYRQKIGG
jgi:YHS domain-containing protein